MDGFERFQWLSTLHSLQNISVTFKTAGNSWLDRPPDTHHVPLTWANAILAHAHFIPYLTMAYLSRRPNTHRNRFLLLPLVVVVTVRCTTHYRTQDPLLAWLNWIRGLMALALIAHSIYFSVVPEGILKVTEQSLQANFDPQRTDEGTTVGSSLVGSLPPCIYDAVEVGGLLRGIGWKFSHGVHVPKARRPSERKAYLKSTLLSCVKTYIMLDLAQSLLESLPGITATGGTIFYPELSPMIRYTVSTVLHIIAGMVIICGVGMWYDLVSLVGVGLLDQSPSRWPPLHDEPWRMDSLHDFWSRRWHQLLRHTFLVYGGYPGRWLAGDLGMLFGTFLASGLFHEFGLYLGGTPIDLRVILFFIAQPIGIVGEKLYRVYTGRRVGGWLGWFWAAIFIAGIGQICTDSWVGRGAGTIGMVPPTLRPATRHILIPLLRASLERVIVM